MQITFTPIRAAVERTLSVVGDVLTVDGEVFDFSGIPDGATLPREAVTCDWLASDVERVNGRLQLTMTLPHGANAPEETRFPQPITITDDGPVDLPAYNEEIEE